MASSRKTVRAGAFDLALPTPDIETGVIHAIHYHRLILDEAHNIKVDTDYSSL